MSNRICLGLDEKYTGNKKLKMPGQFSVECLLDIPVYFYLGRADPSFGNSGDEI
jgi:hypothetical protein